MRWWCIRSRDGVNLEDPPLQLAAPPAPAQPGPSTASLQWHPLERLREQLRANLASLATRDPALAERIRLAAPDQPHVACAAGERVTFGRVDGQTIHPIPNTVPPAHGQQVAKQVFPEGYATEPVMVAGFDQGWIWDALYRLDTRSPSPNCKPPLYLLAADLTKLWFALHIHDWRKMLADSRAMIFGGTDAVAQLRVALTKDPALPVPRLSLTVEPSLWQQGDSGNALYRDVLNAHQQRLNRTTAIIEQAFPDQLPSDIARKLIHGKLRVLGITSRFTTFLQYSMRDWLAAFESLGHETKLVIESNDHQTMTNVVYLEAVAEFKPDLILLIDHYRAEFPGMPKSVPCVMWVQDHLPNIFNSGAGSAQGPLDFSIGYGRTELVCQHAYPSNRFLPAVVGVNSSKFEPLAPTSHELRKYCCDVSFVSHASATAEQILQKQLASIDDPRLTALLHRVFEQLRAVYDDGRAIAHPSLVAGMIRQAAGEMGIGFDDANFNALQSLFTQQVNNALYRHQSLQWLAELGIDLRLYGTGWEDHPTLRQFARGPSENCELQAIYRSSRINLQVSPHGSVHQRLLEGLAAGGFFLIRKRPGDIIERVYKPLYEWCRANDINTDAQLRQNATPEISALIQQSASLLGLDPFAQPFPFVEELAQSGLGEFTLSAGCLWEKEYEMVSFDSRQQLHGLVTHFLKDPEARQNLSSRMRGQVLERLTYASISRRMLSFIANSLT